MKKIGDENRQNFFNDPRLSWQAGKMEFSGATRAYKNYAILTNQGTIFKECLPGPSIHYGTKMHFLDIINLVLVM